MPHSNTKMRLKTAPQKLDFVIVKAISKSYTLDCSCIVTHINAASFSIKNHFMWKYQHCFSNNYWKLGKINAKLNSFWNFAYVSNYLLLFDFCMETRLSNILKTTNVTNFTKTILESSYRVLQVTLR